VFPGLGQLASGHPWRGLLYGGTSVALLAGVLRRVMHEAAARMPTELSELLDPALPFRLAAQIQLENATFFFWMTLGIVAAWGLSVWDAWYSERAKTR
jgi:hypothetical protein